MNNALGDALKQALDAKKNDCSNFVWKGVKRKSGDKYEQEEIRLIDMPDDDLKKAYEHCQTMLYSTNPKHLGRYNVLEEVKDQINKCSVELFLRYCENSYLRNERNSIPRRTFWLSLREFMQNANQSRKEQKQPEIDDWNTIPISVAASHLPEEFESLKIGEILDGCIGYLGSFDKVHLTMTFITRMGIWFTKSEENEMKVPNNSNIERIKIAKEKLKLPESWPLKLSDKGLTFHEMRAMLTLPKKQRYVDMTTEQLVTLRDKVLLRFQKQVDGHIFSWKKLQKQIVHVANLKGINLND